MEPINMDEHTREVLANFVFVVINALLESGMTVDEYIQEIGERAAQRLKTDYDVDMTVEDIALLLELGMTVARGDLN